MPLRLGGLFEHATRLQTAVVAGALFALGAAVFLPGLGRAPFYHLVEGDQALVVLKIYGGQWVLPMLNGDTLPSKPPLFNWLAAIASLCAGGVTEATMRIPSALVSAAGLGVTYAVGRRLVGPPAALAGALFLLTTPVYAKQARDGTTDAVLAFCLLAALALFYTMYDRREWSGWRRQLFFLSIAGAVLTKGPVGCALPVLACGSFLIVQRDLDAARRLLAGADKWIAIAIPLAWYGAACYLGGRAFVDKQFFDENLRRFMGGFGLPKPVTALILPSLSEAAPWSILLVVELVRLAATRSWTNGTRFLTCWWVTMLVFFSLSVGKRTIYLLPLYPAAALLAADQAWRLASRSRETSAAAPIRIGRGEWAGLAAACAGAVLSTGMARLVSPTSSKQPSEPMEMVQFFVWQHPAMVALLVAVALVALLASIARAREGDLREIPLIGAIALVVFYATVFPLVRDHHKEVRSVKSFGLHVAATVPREEPLFFYRYGSKELPGYLYFYVGRDIPVAPCMKFPNGCPAGYYLMWQRDWHPGGESVAAGAELVARSADTALYPRYRPFVLVRLPARVGS